jgi:signal transduction histidine kinase
LDTKLRKYSTSNVTKSLLFILTVLFTTIALTIFQYTLLEYKRIDALFYEDYTESDAYEDLLIDTANDLDYAFLNDITPDTGNNIYYYVETDTKDKYSNIDKPTKNSFQSYYQYYLILEDNELSIVNGKEYKESYNYQINSNFTTVYLALNDEYVKDKQGDWDELRDKLITIVVIETILIISSLTFIIYLIVVTGKIPADSELHIYPIDNVSTEIHFGIMIGVLLTWGTIISNTSYTYRSGVEDALPNSAKSIILIITACTTALFMATEGYFFLSIIRKLKGKILIKSSFIYKTCSRFYNFIKSLFDGRAFSNYPLTKALFYRQIVFIAASILFVLLTFLLFMSESFLFIFSILLELLILSWYIKGNNETYEQINEGFNESMEEQLKSERMKVDLVTNVSHDLKTPLTSIISYVDLLSKEEDLSETARDYVQILGDKSERLKKIVEDLFDLAKATSGDIALKLEVLDLKKLIEQTVADMEDAISTSHKKVVLNLNDTPLLIYADGDKMYRVFQNIIDNSLKYSLDNTRIFVSTLCEGEMVTVTVMNTANYEMDFSEKEIVERFYRGDKSRSTDGSGLGLSIAEGFTNACHGHLNVSVEGDIFKVSIRFKLIENSNM